MYWKYRLSFIAALALVSCSTVKTSSIDAHLSASSRLTSELDQIETTTKSCEDLRRVITFDFTDRIIEEFDPVSGALIRRTTESNSSQQEACQVSMMQQCSADSLHTTTEEEGHQDTSFHEDDHTERHPPDKLFNISLLFFILAALFFYRFLNWKK